jgi:hypothetical protein
MEKVVAGIKAVVCESTGGNVLGTIFILIIRLSTAVYHRSSTVGKIYLCLQ